MANAAQDKIGKPAKLQDLIWLNFKVFTHTTKGMEPIIAMNKVNCSSVFKYIAG